jgi:hypothetical protein
VPNYDLAALCTVALVGLGVDTWRWRRKQRDKVSEWQRGIAGLRIIYQQGRPVDEGPDVVSIHDLRPCGHVVQPSGVEVKQ